MIRRPPRSSLFPISTLFLFFFNDTATTEIYTLSLHDALPIYHNLVKLVSIGYTEGFYHRPRIDKEGQVVVGLAYPRGVLVVAAADGDVDLAAEDRSEEHTSELQSHLNLVCRLLLEKKKTHDQTLLCRHVEGAMDQRDSQKHHEVCCQIPSPWIVLTLTIRTVAYLVFLLILPFLVVD